MTRKQAIFAIFMLPLGSWRGLRAESKKTERGAMGSKLPVGPASLTIDLDQWSSVKVRRGGKEVVLDVSEVFAALQAGGAR
jgi:hypothetical protein